VKLTTTPCTGEFDVVITGRRALIVRRPGRRS
jgi:hypothetical protein